MYAFKTKGTCSKRIDLEIEDNVIKSCTFSNGCEGNLQGIGKLVVGHNVDDVIEMLSGIQCRNGTSCPDQLAQALRKYKAETSK
ncbi:MAG TPA: TIGR03905 family TSCPD domain-containing protein [Clostridia bacterium]|nr:TIGR03905 family TSCPD domain-containing protein [Clostridia bacterium]